MMLEEFKVWLKHHTNRFTSLADKVSSTEPAKAWYQVLKHIDLGDAKQISDDMFSGVEDAPRWVDSHPKAIRAIANKKKYGEGNINKDHPEKPKEKVIDGRTVFTCSSCQDTGLVTVWSPVAMRAARAVIRKEAEWNNAKHIRKCSVACVCNWGYQQNNRLKTPRLTLVDNMCIFDGSTEEDIDELFRFIVG